jgi:hypothetical protein
VQALFGREKVLLRFPNGQEPLRSRIARPLPAKRGPALGDLAPATSPRSPSVIFAVFGKQFPSRFQDVHAPIGVLMFVV